jgi:muramoyltetrapeptide carboxypeptidase
MGKIKIPLLKAGDSVALIAPARKVSAEEMQAFKIWIESKNLLLKEGKHLYGSYHQFSGTDAERAEDFIEAWQNPAIKAVFCARGGYGSMRWLHLVPESVFQNAEPKAFIGYSDVTTIHLKLNNLGLESLHGIMAHSFYAPKPGFEQSLKSLENALFAGKIEFGKDDLGELEFLRPGKMQGNLVGGNLSLIYAALGTPEQPETKNKILFLEDLDEYLYHFDRMIYSLNRAGLFKDLAGLIVGDMIEMRDNAVPFGFDTKQIIENAVGEYSFPVIFNFPAGHGAKNLCLKLNAFTTFDGTVFTQK